MRNGMLGLVAALAGCNQIWGNDPVERWDAPSPSDVLADAALPTARLEFLFASATTAPLDVREDAVQVGLIGAPLSPTRYNKGVISIPAHFPGQMWRLVYTPVGDVPHEIHWNPAPGTEGRAVFPRFVAPGREPVPPNASYKLKTDTTSSYTNLRVYTTGVWAVAQPTPAMIAGSVVTQPVTASAFKTFGGELRAPDPNKGDRVVLVDYEGLLPCQPARGAAVFSIPLTGPDSTTAEETLVMGGGGVHVTGYGAAELTRVVAQYGVPQKDVIAQVLFGYGASTVAPMFVTHPLGSALYGPAMIPLIRCVKLWGTNTELSVDRAFAKPSLSLPLIANVQIYMEHGVLGGEPVYDGLSGVFATPSQTRYDVTFPVGIPLDIKLGGESLIGDDEVQLESGTGTLDLTFTLDSPTPGGTGVADYATATLYRVGATLVREREYTFTGTTLHLDRAVFAAHTEYVIELRTFMGAPGAADADFTRYDASQSSATRWTSTFITP